MLGAHPSGGGVWRLPASAPAPPRWAAGGAGPCRPQRPAGAEARQRERGQKGRSAPPPAGRAVPIGGDGCPGQRSAGVCDGPDPGWPRTSRRRQRCDALGRCGGGCVRTRAGGSGVRGAEGPAARPADGGPGAAAKVYLAPRCQCQQGRRCPPSPRLRSRRRGSSRLAAVPLQPCCVIANGGRPQTAERKPEGGGVQPEMGQVASLGADVCRGGIGK